MSRPTSHKAPLPNSYELLDELLGSDVDLAAQLAHVGIGAGQLAPETEVIRRHFNKPQLRSMAVGANEEYAVWGRGTGKSEGLIAPRSARNAQVMPRSHGCFVGATYLQLLERTLPPVVKGWEQMGLVRGQDFWIRERPPKKLKLPEPIVGPLTTDHCIYWRNGSVISLVSQDRPGSANGKTVHWIGGDEAKFLNKQKLDNELLMTNRGDERYFGGIPEFHSLLFCTDMPTSKAASWILDMEKQGDPQRIDVLLALQASIYRLYETLTVYSKRRNATLKLINELQGQWDSIRANTTYFSEASTLDNIHGFGAKNLARLRRILPTFIFRTAILNQRPGLTEQAFYPDLAERHFYDAYDYAFIDSFNFGQGQYEDSRKDADVDKYRPLDIALDYGALINPLLVGQPNGKQYRVLKELYVRHPERVRDVAKAFCDYYRFHAEKTVFYYYDHTAIASNSVDEESPAAAVAEVLRANGWTVEEVYLGHTASPTHRYELWGRCLRGGDTQLYDVRFNRQNCQYVRVSMEQTQIKEGRTGFGKDKGDERKPELDQRETTHFSDTADTLLVGAHQHHQFGTRETFDAVFVS